MYIKKIWRQCIIVPVHQVEIGPCYYQSIFWLLNYILQTILQTDCSTNTFVIHQLINWAGHPLVPICSIYCYSQTIRARELKFWENVHPTPCVMCHVSRVTCNFFFIFYFFLITKSVKSFVWHVTGDTWHLTSDTWHMTRDTWHATRDTWHMAWCENSLKISAL